MEYVFETIDKSGRKIRLTKKQWSHIRQHHAEVETPGEIEETLQNPTNIILDEREDVENFFRFFKHQKQKSKFLKVIVRFLNTEGYVITAYFVRMIK